MSRYLLDDQMDMSVMNLEFRGDVLAEILVAKSPAE